VPLRLTKRSSFFQQVIIISQQLTLPQLEIKQTSLASPLSFLGAVELAGNGLSQSHGQESQSEAGVVTVYGDLSNLL